MKFALLISIVLLAVIPYSSQGALKTLLGEASEQTSRILQSGTSQVSQGFLKGGDYLRQARNIAHDAVSEALKRIEKLLTDGTKELEQCEADYQSVEKDTAERGNDVLKQIKEKTPVTDNATNPHQSHCKSTLVSLYEIAGWILNDATTCIKTYFEKAQESYRNLRRSHEEAKKSAEKLEQEKQKCKNEKRLPSLSEMLCSSKAFPQLLNVLTTSLAEMGQHYGKLVAITASFSYSMSTCVMTTGYHEMIIGMNQLFSGWRGCTSLFFESAKNCVFDLYSRFQICSSVESTTKPDNPCQKAVDAIQTRVAPDSKPESVTESVRESAPAVQPRAAPDSKPEAVMKPVPVVKSGAAPDLKPEAVIESATESVPVVESSPDSKPESVVKSVKESAVVAPGKEDDSGTIKQEISQFVETVVASGKGDDSGTIKQEISQFVQTVVAPGKEDDSEKIKQEVSQVVETVVAPGREDDSEKIKQEVSQVVETAAAPEEEDDLGTMTPEIVQVLPPPESE